MCLSGASGAGADLLAALPHPDLLLAAARGYAGCESLAITNWLLRRDDQVGCVVFSPLDAIEARATGKAAADAG